MDIETKIKLYSKMVLIRTVEESISESYNQQKMRCPTHLSTGQEAVSAAAGMALKKDDLVVSTHRSHGHYLGKGGSVSRMIAEIYGKEGGCSKGKGGSMHLIDLSVGFMGSTAIVGNSIPIGAGLGLAKKLEEVYLPGISNPQNISKTSSALYLLRNIRDEVHRFSITFHRLKRKNDMFSSKLNNIKGVGKQRISIIWKNYDSLSKFKKDSIKNINAKTNIPVNLIKQIKSIINK